MHKKLRELMISIKYTKTCIANLKDFPFRVRRAKERVKYVKWKIRMQHESIYSLTLDLKEEESDLKFIIAAKDKGILSKNDKKQLKDLTKELTAYKKQIQNDWGVKYEDA